MNMKKNINSMFHINFTGKDAFLSAKIDTVLNSDVRHFLNDCVSK